MFKFMGSEAYIRKVLHLFDRCRDGKNDTFCWNFSGRMGKYSEKLSARNRTRKYGNVKINMKLQI
jgi:hypothetical protein